MSGSVEIRPATTGNKAFGILAVGHETWLDSLLQGRGSGSLVSFSNLPAGLNNHLEIFGSGK